MNEEERMGHRIHARQRWQPSRFAQERMKTHSGIAGVSCRARRVHEQRITLLPSAIYLPELKPYETPRPPERTAMAVQCGSEPHNLIKYSAVSAHATQWLPEAGCA
jgi:hypothetical protein